MNKTIKYTITVIWILFSRIYDAYCTHQFTPDLSTEANPLVSIFGLSWTPLLIILGLLTIYTLYTYYISVFKPINLLPTEKGYTFSNIVAYTYLGHKDNWISILYKLPKDFNRFNQYMGQLLTSCLVYAGILSTIMWLLINKTEYYYKEIHSSTLIYLILITGAIAIIYNWNKTKYKEYLALK